MIEAVHEENLSEFENYIKLNPRGSYLQGSKWARQNPAWHWRGYLRRNEYKRVTGVVSFLCKSIPFLPFQILYAGRGPLFDEGDYDTLRELLGALRTAAREESAAIVRLDPPVDETESEVLDILESNDYERVKHRGVSAFHSRHNWVFETKNTTWEKLTHTFSPDEVQNVQFALRQNVDIRRGGKALAGAYGRMSERAALRDTRQSEKTEYYSGMMEAYGDHAKIFLACVEGRPVAGAVMILTGSRFECAARVDLSEPSLHAASLLETAVLKTAVTLGCDSVSFPYSGASQESSPVRFDSGFGGHAQDLLGEMDWYVRPILGLVAKLVLRIDAWVHRKVYFVEIR